MSEHVIGIRTYVTIYVILLVLTAITVGAAFTDLGRINVVLMLLIAAVKATLVILWFMHVRFEGRLVHVAAAAGFAWLGIMIAFTMSDYLTREVVTGWSAGG
jgi:cytochrome c oxidase subunit 4